MIEKVDLMTRVALKVPAKIRQYILEEGFIDKAKNVMLENTPMEYLFDVYEEFIDVTGEHDDWTCHQCREYVLTQWKKLLPHLIHLQKISDVQ